MYENETGKISDSDHRVLICGRGELVAATAKVFAERGARVAVVGDPAPLDVDGCISVTAEDDAAGNDAAGNDAGVIGQATEKLGGLTVIVNICLPLPEYGIEFVNAYPERLRSLCAAAAGVMVRSEGSPAIINHCAMPAMYVGTELEDYMGILRGGVTGITRTFARKFGKQGLRVTAVQTGILDLADDSWVSQTVKEVALPVKAPASLEEVAKFMAFLSMDSTYTTGQTMIMDGGLTAGISGI